MVLVADGMVVGGTILLGVTGMAGQSTMVRGDHVSVEAVWRRGGVMGLPKMTYVLAGATPRAAKARAQVPWLGAEPVVE